MGVFFPVHPPEDVNKLERKKRTELKLEIMKVLMTDPEVDALLKEKMPELKALLKSKTQDLFDKMRRS
jgi:hypothetical protein